MRSKIWTTPMTMRARTFRSRPGLRRAVAADPAGVRPQGAANGLDGRGERRPRGRDGRQAAAPLGRSNGDQGAASGRPAVGLAGGPHRVEIRTDGGDTEDRHGVAPLTRGLGGPSAVIRSNRL